MVNCMMIYDQRVYGTHIVSMWWEAYKRISLYSRFICHPEPHISMYIKRPASHNITDNHHVY